jgi:NAD(P)-dependent dehydrogenase (short-subunit alcohol dehydrogenase family)
MLDAGDKIAKITKHEEPNAMGRVGEPIEIAGVIAFLLGPDSTYVSGMVYGADGGWAC